VQRKLFHPKTLALIPVALILIVSPLAMPAAAQTVRIDATPSHVANTFSPLRALGTTVDRIPSNTTDIFFFVTIRIHSAFPTSAHPFQSIAGT